MLLQEAVAAFKDYSAADAKGAAPKKKPAPKKAPKQDAAPAPPPQKESPPQQEQQPKPKPKPKQPSGVSASAVPTLVTRGVEPLCRLLSSPHNLAPRRQPDSSSIRAADTGTIEDTIQEG